MRSAGALSRFIVAPENRAAWLAIQEILATCAGEPARCPMWPVLLHGPGGTGKTYLATALIRELSRRQTGLILQQITANDWKTLEAPARSLKNSEQKNSGQKRDGTEDSEPVWLAEARNCDFLVIEDVQHLPLRAAEKLVQLLDARRARRLPTLLTSCCGPRHLRFSARLTSRLAAGLVVGLEPLSAPSRLLLLQEFAQRRQLAVAGEILQWLAAHLTGGGRQLEGAVAQLHTLTKMQAQPLKLADVRPHFRVQIDALRPTVERIVQHVGGHFKVLPQEMLSRRRMHAVLVPRQIGMYLARQLTQLSFKQIGVSFGGHDHTTVLHACRKIEGAMRADPLLSGAVRQLQAELG